MILSALLLVGMIDYITSFVFVGFSYILKTREEHGLAGGNRFPGKPDYFDMASSVTSCASVFFSLQDEASAARLPVLMTSNLPARDSFEGFFAALRLVLEGMT